MSQKNKKARKAYWSTIPPEERSKRMSELAKKRHAKLTQEEKNKIGKTLAKAHWG